MITQNIETYKCEYCRKLYQKKDSCITHEIRCGKNPDNHRPCFECSHLVKKKTTVFAGVGDMQGNEAEASVMALFCTAKGHYLIPPKSVHKGNAWSIADGEDHNDPMPRLCEQQSSH